MGIFSVRKLIASIVMLFFVLTANAQLKNTDSYSDWLGSMRIWGTNGTLPYIAQFGKDSTTKGIILPRVMDTSNVISPTKGTLAYITPLKDVYVYDGTKWKVLGSSMVIPNAVDSLRRLPGSKNVEARKNNQWTTQYIDSVGAIAAGAVDSLRRLPGSTAVEARISGTWRTQFNDSTGIPSGCFGLTSGGYVTWSRTGLIYDVSAGTFCANNISYSFNAGQVVAPTASTFPRKDIVVANTDGTVSLIAGTASPDPVTPGWNPATQCYLATVFVPANAVIPIDITDVDIYRENVEWTGTSNIAGTNFNYSTLPYEGTKSTLVGTFTAGQTVTYTSSTNIDIAGITYLRFYLKLNAALNSTTFLSAAFKNGASTVFGNLNIPDGKYGFSRLVTSYQLIVVPIADFPIITQSNFINTFVLTTSGTSAATLQLDNIVLQKGGINPLVSTPTWDQVMARDSVTRHNVILQNFTLATSAAKGNNSPIISFPVNWYDSVGAVSRTDFWDVYTITNGATSTPNSDLFIKNRVTNKILLKANSNGDLAIGNGLVFGATSRIASGTTISYAGNSSTLKNDFFSTTGGLAASGVNVRMGQGASTSGLLAKTLLVLGDRNLNVLSGYTKGVISNHYNASSKAVIDFNGAENPITGVPSGPGKGVLFPRMNTAQRDGIPKRVANYAITNGGTGYDTLAPTITATSNVGGVPAAFTPIITAGVITGIIIDYGGTGYTSSGSLIFTGGSGSGAAGTYTVTTDTIDNAMMIFNTDSACHQSYDRAGNVWKNMQQGSTSGGGGVGGVTSVSGTPNQIASTGGTTPVLSISSTYVGQGSITTVGSLVSGSATTGFTLGDVTINVAGTDATGDVYFRNASGIIARLGIGSTGQVITVAGGLPSWATPTSGTVTAFSKTDGYGIISSVTNSTTTPNYTSRVDTATLFTALRATINASSLKTDNAYFNITSSGGVDTLHLNANQTFANLTSTGIFHISSIQVFADNTTALGGGLVAGDLYRTGDDLKICH